MKLLTLAAGLCALVANLAAADSTFSPARPPAIPLAVRSPYLTTWQFAGSDGGNGGYLAGAWPVHWTGDIVGWTGVIRVDGQSWAWMGAPLAADYTSPLQTVSQTSFEYTSTRSIFTLDAGGLVTIKVEFLSPVSPEDLQHQSLVYSYMNIEVSSADGNSHDVSVYTDISGEWASFNRDTLISWDYETSGDVGYHNIHRQTQLEFTDDHDRAEWGEWYYGVKASDGLTFQSGSDRDVRAQYLNNGNLANTKDTAFRAINDNFPVFGLSIDYGSVSSGNMSTTFAIGLAQDQAVQFHGDNGYQPYPSLWKSYYSDGVDALVNFLDEYDDATANATTLDNKIQSDANAAGGQDYVTITSLALRQAFAGTQLTNTPEQPWLFLKEISSDGNMQTVDVIYPFHPVLLYTNPELLKYLLDPLFVNQRAQADQYDIPWSTHDLGVFYPNATGRADAEGGEPQHLEESGNMLIMTLAYAQRTNDVDYVNQNYDLLKKWADFSIGVALIPNGENSTDDFAGDGSNQTDLAVKGIIGLGAFSQLANLTGHDDDAQNFSSIASDYVTRFPGLAYSSDGTHATYFYNNEDSWGLLYNLFADRELGLNLFPQSIYDMQSSWYASHMGTYGVLLKWDQPYTKNDWEMWVAAYASDDVKASLHQKLATWINETPTNRPLTDLYNVEGGDYPNHNFADRPVVGGFFAELALPSMNQAGIPAANFNTTAPAKNSTKAH